MYRNKKMYGPLLALIALLSGYQAGAQQERRVMNFDAGWKFHPGNAADPAKDFHYGITDIFSKSGNAGHTAIAANFDDKDWQDINLPHDWVVSLPFADVKNGDVESHGYKPVGGLFPENSIGWYRKRFSLPSADSGKRYYIQFDGVYRDSKLWLNGYYIGGHFSGYTGAIYDITDFIRFGKTNELVVRVDATQYEGWFYEGAGIYRHAWLIGVDDVHAAMQGGLFVYTQDKGKDAQVTVQATVENNGLRQAKATVQLQVTDRGGKILQASGEIPVTLDIRSTQMIQQQLLLKNAFRWNLDNPYLYRAVAIIRVNGVEVDRVKTRFGVRTITMDANNGLFLNGQPVKVYGTSNHQDHAGVGSALPDYLQYYRIGLLKEMGCNAYRTTHNPPTPELLDACDSLGMLVMDETRLLTSGEEYAGQLKDLVLRDRNHPSVFIWSIGNEEFATQRTDIGKRIAQDNLLLLKKLDPSRTATYAANMGNVYNGVNEVIPVRGFNYNLGGADAYHQQHPQQPVIGTEVASTVSTRGVFIKDTAHAYVPDYDSVYPPWASTAEQWWTFAAKRSWFMGGFAWTGFDYRGEPTPYNWPNVNSHFGIMDVCGFPKTVYYYYQSWWTNKDVLHIAPHWNWKGEEGKDKLVWVNTNADNVELFLNGKSLGKKEMPHNGHLTWKVPYSPGVLEAVAYKNGRKITARTETTGDPYQVILTPSRIKLTADNEDATVVNVSVKDREGREVPDAANLIRFNITGTDATIFGVGNGDPSSHEADKCSAGNWQRHLFNGHAQLIIRAGQQAGSIILKAAGDNLLPATVTISEE